MSSVRPTVLTGLHILDVIFPLCDFLVTVYWWLLLDTVWLGVRVHWSGLPLEYWTLQWLNKHVEALICTGLWGSVTWPLPVVPLHEGWTTLRKTKDVSFSTEVPITTTTLDSSIPCYVWWIYRKVWGKPELLIRDYFKIFNISIYMEDIYTYKYVYVIHIRYIYKVFVSHYTLYISIGNVFS